MKNVLSLCLIVSSLYCFGQSSISSQPQNSVRPVSPQISSLGTYEKNSINHYIGKPEISIPLYTAKTGNITLPISLDYDASGVKYNQAASWVGLSWNLTSGGFISRNVVGDPDEFVNGYWNFENRLHDLNSTHVPGGSLNRIDSLLIAGFKDKNIYPSLQNTDTILIDSKPDMFSYNFSGYRGEFVILRGGGGNLVFDNSNNQSIVSSNSNDFQFLLIPKQDLKFEVFGLLDSFHVTAPDGNIYCFAKKVNQYYQKTALQNRFHDFQGLMIQQDPPILHSQTRPSAWLLTQIILTNNNSIDFEYDYLNISDEFGSTHNLKLDTLHDVFDQLHITGASVLHGNISPLPETIDKSEHWKYSRFDYLISDSSFRVSKISTPYENIIFYAVENPLNIPVNCITCPRKDLINGHPFSFSGLDVRLDSIRVLTKDNKLIKRVLLDYEYFLCNGNANIEKELRLKLKKVSVGGRNNSILPAYEFDYDERKVDWNGGGRIDGHDFWGFYNGINNSTKTDLPGFDVFVDCRRYTLSGDNRNFEIPNTLGQFPYNQTSILKKITFPTGGYKEFTFEPHDFGYVLDKEKNQKNETPTKIMLNSITGSQTQNFVVYETQAVSLKAKLASRVKNCDLTAPLGLIIFPGIFPSTIAPGDPGQYFCHGYQYLFPYAYDFLRFQEEPFAHVSKQYPYTFSSPAKYAWLNSFGPNLLTNGTVAYNEGYENQLANTIDPLSCFPTSTGSGGYSGANPISRPIGTIKVEKETSPGMYTLVFEFGPNKWNNAYIDHFGDFNYMGDMGVTLEPGNYKLTVDYPNSATNGPFAFAELAYTSGIPTKVSQAGGLRIKKIKEYDPFTNKSVYTAYRYRKLDDVNRSSGHLGSECNFLNIYQIPATYGMSFPVYHTEGDGTSFGGSLIQNYTFAGYAIMNYLTFDLSNTTKSPIGISFSNNVVYDDVQEMSVDQNGNMINGFTNYNMFSYNDLSCRDEDLDLLSVTSNHYKRGLPKEVSIFNTMGDMVSNTLYSYTNIVQGSPDREYAKCFTGLTMNQHCFDNNWPFMAGTNPAFARVHLSSYKIFTSSWLLSSQETTSFNEITGAPISQLTSYSYGNKKHILPSTIIKQLSNGNSELQKTYYPEDYINISSTTSDPNLLAIKRMKELHINNTPIESLKIFYDGTNYQVESGDISKYIIHLLNGKDQVLKEKFDVIRISAPYNFNNHLLSNSSTNIFNSDTRFVTEKKYDIYDKFGSCRQIVQNELSKSSILYGYKDRNIVAVISNASIKDVAHCDFEFKTGNPDLNGWIINPLGGWNSLNSFNGNWSYDLFQQTPITKTNLDISKNYILSFWSNSVNGTGLNISGATLILQGETINGWTYYEYNVTGVTSVSINGIQYIDELRFYPEESQMVTYTYLEEKGLISTIDQNNSITRFEFDDLNRLKLIRDKYGNITTKNEYSINNPD